MTRLLSSAALTAFVLFTLALTGSREVSALVACDTGAAPSPVSIYSSCQLTSDVEFSTAGFIIESDNVTLDLNGYEIRGAFDPCEEICQVPPDSPIPVGVEISKHIGVEVRDGTVRGFIYGLVLRGSEGISIKNVSASDNNFNGFVLNDTYQSELKGCAGIGNGAFAVLVQDGSANNVIHGCSFEDNEIGVYVRGTGAGGPSNNNLIQGNSVGGCGTGIQVSAGYSNVVQGNSVFNCAEEGITIRQGSANVVRGNLVEDSIELGILINEAPGSVVKGNTVMNSGTQGVRVVESENVLLEGNSVSQSGTIGINLVTTLSGHVKANNVSGSATQGIRLSTAVDMVVIENRIRDSGILGLAIAGSNDNLINGNAISNSGLYGINVTGSSEGNDFLNNTAKSSNSFDIKDTTSGTGTEGTANTYVANNCALSDPDSLCD